MVDDGENYEVLYITSHKSLEWVEISEADFIDGGIDRISYIKVSKSMPFDKSLFTSENYLGKLSHTKMRQVLSKIIAKYQIIISEFDEYDNK